MLYLDHEFVEQFAKEKENNGETEQKTQVLHYLLLFPNTVVGLCDSMDGNHKTFNIYKRWSDSSTTFSICTVLFGDREYFRYLHLRLGSTGCIFNGLVFCLIAEQCTSSQNSPDNVLLQTTLHESFIKSDEETKHCVSQNIAETKCFGTETTTKELFLSSPKFHSDAEELFYINSNNAIHLEATSLHSDKTNDRRLLLDCANELMQNRILWCKQTVHPLLLAPGSLSKSFTSLSQLAEEVSEGIGTLRSYSKNFGEKFHKDNLLSVLERDLKCWGVVSGGWDLGWKHSFTADDVEQAIGDVEKLVFSELIEDMFPDFIH